MVCVGYHFCSVKKTIMAFKVMKYQLHETLDQFNPLHLSLLLLSFFALYIRLIRGKNKLKLPPSPPQLPFIGNLHQLGKPPHHSLRALAKKHGPVMLMKLGHIPTVVISSADIAREVMKTHDTAFSDRPQLTAPKVFFYGCKDVAFCSYGEYWRQAKKISALELLSAKRVQSFHYVREEECQILLKRLKSACLDGSSVNLTDLLLLATNNVALRCMFGTKFDDGNGKSKYGELARRIQELLLTFCFTDYFPSLSWIDNLRGFKRQLKETHDEFDVFLGQLIKEHKAKLGSDQYDKQSKVKDFIDILLEVQRDGEFEITDSNIKAILLDLVLAGSDTSATTMEWAMAELIKSPTKMKKVQEEVRRVMGKKTEIEQCDLNEMHYLDCVIKEALRLHPSGPPLIPRKTSTVIKDIGGYDIPSDTRIIVNIFAIQRDLKLWENPDTFIPERFIENPIEFKSQDNFKLIPFGGGRRGCHGMTFALVSIKYFMAHILYWFDWKLADKSLIAEELNMDEHTGIVVTKEVPLHLNPLLYSP